MEQEVSDNQIIKKSKRLSFKKNKYLIISFVLLLITLPIIVIASLSRTSMFSKANTNEVLPQAALKENPPKPFIDESQRGLVWAGLKANDNARCNNAFSIVDNNGNFLGCTHGPDPAPAGVDVTETRDTQEIIASADSIGVNNVPCIGDGTSGKRVQMIYAVSSDVVDRYNDLLPTFNSWAGLLDLAVNESAAKTGGERHIRLVTNPDCSLNVEKVILSPAGDDSFSSTVGELQALGYTRSDRKYVLWSDARVYCGIAQVRTDTKPTLDNLNNARGGYARVDAGCWGRSDHLSELHELMHTLGAVQPSSSHATSGFHCTDENDAMCYRDAAEVVMTYPCASSNERLLDCNNDDYFAVNPEPNSYLATHWNVASSEYLTVLNAVNSPTPTPNLGVLSTPTPIPSPTDSPTPTPTIVPTSIPTPTTGIVDSIKPTVSVATPLNGAIIPKNSNFYITVNASDNNAVSKVETYVNSALICTQQGTIFTQYQCLWKVPGKKNGKYTITTRAFDSSNNSSTASVNVTAQ